MRLSDPRGADLMLAARVFADNMRILTSLYASAFASTDVGGGSVANDTAHTLARIPLRWMIRECFKTDTGIRFHAELLRRIGLDPFSLHPTVRDRPPPMVPEPAHVDSVALPVSQHTEEDHEVRDAISPIYDQLEIAWMSWWPLELLPTTKKNKTGW